jgi:CBS domain-containing protein
VVGEDLRATLLERDAIPLLVVGDLLRSDPPVVSRDETLDDVLEKFSRHDVASLPVAPPGAPDKIVGMISRVRLMHRYQQMLKEV